MSSYPAETVRIMRGTMEGLKSAVRFHYARRHSYGNKPCKMWIAAYREADASSGYSEALKQTQRKA